MLPTQAHQIPTKVSSVHRTFLVLVLALTALPAWKLFATLPSTTATLEQVIPVEARAGQLVTASGYALDAGHVQELYLIDERNAAYKTEIFYESGTALHFQVPQNIPAGWMRIAIKAPDKARLIDQMPFLKVLDPLG